MSRLAEYDVAIIGAGPAGSAAAIELARAGRHVVLIERKSFPRHKVCGGCLSGPAALRLRELVGPQQIPPGIPGRRVTFVIGSYRLTCDPRGATWMVMRSEMDDYLAQCAAAAGADVWYGQSATLRRDGDRWAIVAGERIVQANTVLIASGIGSLPRSIGIEGRSTGRPMIAQQWVQPPVGGLPGLGEVELHWLRGGYVGLATPRPDTCVVALAAEAPDGAGESAFARLRRTNPNSPIWQVLGADAPRRYAARGSAGFPWLPRRLGDANVLLIGDAAGYAEPYSGEGIGQAMCSASCAVEAILGGGDILAAYTAMMRLRHRRVVWRTRLVSMLLSFSIVHRLAAIRPVLPRRALARLVEHVHVTGVL